MSFKRKRKLNFDELNNDIDFNLNEQNNIKPIIQDLNNFHIQNKKFKTNSKDEIIQDLKKKINTLEIENKILKTKLNHNKKKKDKIYLSYIS